MFKVVGSKKFNDKVCREFEKKNAMEKKSNCLLFQNFWNGIVA